MMSLVYHKCIVLFIVLIVTLLAGTSPWLLLRLIRKKRDNNNISQKSKFKSIFSCMNMFSGGVFLGVCFMHMLPEVREQMKYFLSELKSTKDFPATEFLVVVGFFLVVISEILVSQCLSKKQKQKSDSNGKYQEYDRLQGDNSPAEGSLVTDTTCEEVSKYGTIDNSFTDSNQIKQNDNKSIQVIRSRDISTYSLEEGNDGHSDHSHLPFSEIDAEESMIRSVLLFLALSLHTVFDGLSLGLQENVSHLYSLFMGVIIHKIFVGFTLGHQIFEYSKWTVKRSFCLMGVFACVSPIGMAVGIVIGGIQGHEMARAAAASILNSLATGTFLYVTFIEIIGRELSKKASVVQILFSIVGFGVMTGLVFLE